MMTFAQWIAQAEQRLTQVGVENARFEARLLLCEELNIETQILIAYPEREITDGDLTQLDALLNRRCAREPMSHILGYREFWSLRFKVTKDTLTPRPDSETLIEAVLRRFPDPAAALSVLDLGVGTGCLLLSVLHEYENAVGLGVDLSPAALVVAKENAESLGLNHRSQWQLGNWAENVEGPFDLILSNPPYIPLVDKEALDQEVRDFEPDTALFAGDDGLDDYRKLAMQIPNLLAPKGIAVIELGINQGSAVSALMAEHGLSVLERARDLGGIERCLVICKKT